MQTGSTWYDNSGTTNNRLKGVTYDSSGNQTQFPEATGWTAFYDAENRLTTISGSNSVSYFYDGEGKRIKKNADGTLTAYVRNSDGELMAEYGGTTPASSRYYLVQDHLGSTRRGAVSLGGSFVREAAEYGWDVG